MFNTARLQVVLEIARHGTIVAAAEQLRLSPSAVSHQLATLEQEAGVALVDRGPRSLRLTVAGQRLADYAQQIIDLMSAARDELSAHGEGRRGLLRIGFFATAGTELLPRALSSFTADHPQVELALILGQPSDLLPRLNQGELDLVVVFDHPLSPTPDVSFAKVCPLMVDPQLVVLPAGHPLAGRRLRLTDLADEPWITTLGVQGEVSVLELAARAEGFQPRIRCRSDHYEVVLGLVRAGVGVALVPSLGLRDSGEVAVQPLDHANLHREIGVALRPGNPNPVVGSFVDRLTDAAAGLSQELAERWPRVPASRSTAVPHRRSSPTAARSAPGGNAATTA
ncbi:LysR family transcriptional regulator [Micromonospora cremea]|uniref:DNA-binding transcriptional regulator, LysR family n=1 Tax=Micromonospora cremea TaxID=709881 RepID=A0A1N5WRW4_9ACTN|nr:LysR family transcriptional regulator [Micromonospora cremea]SIM87087.1 DNA-binding transcriptional regulator, LysR family [Micromonospora cremea]